MGGVSVGFGDGVGVGTGVGVGRQPVAVHASQQLEYCPTQALPPEGALQRAALPTTLQLVWPKRFVRQHDTAPGLPQVDLLAQRITDARHDAGSWPAVTRFVVTPRAHDRNAPREPDVVGQPHEV
jgi:hypothetical protein